MPTNFGGTGVLPSLLGLATNKIALAGGEVFTIPAGDYLCKPGKYTTVQIIDPIMGIWVAIGGGETGASTPATLHSDGVNYRFANQSGCAVGALITNAGSAYTSNPTITVSAGGSIWKPIIGGAVATSVTVSNGGSNYTYPPMVLFSAPGSPGIQATGYCTLSAGAVNAVTVVDQGAGYAIPPTISFVNDPREFSNGNTVGYGASAVATITGAGTMTGLLCVDHGSVVTGTTLPTLTITGGGGSAAAATVIMDWSITAYVVSTTTTGSGYVGPTLLSAYGGFSATAPAYTNVSTQSQLLKGRLASILASIITGAFTATGQTVFDGGAYPGIPTVYVVSSNVPGAGAVAAVFLSPTMGANGGANADVSYLNPT